MAESSTDGKGIAVPAASGDTSNHGSRNQSTTNPCPASTVSYAQKDTTIAPKNECSYNSIQRTSSPRNCLKSMMSRPVPVGIVQVNGLAYPKGTFGSRDFVTVSAENESKGKNESVIASLKVFSATKLAHRASKLFDGTVPKRARVNISSSVTKDSLSSQEEVDKPSSLLHYAHLQPPIRRVVQKDGVEASTSHSDFTRSRSTSTPDAAARSTMAITQFPEPEAGGPSSTHHQVQTFQQRKGRGKTRRDDRQRSNSRPIDSFMQGGRYPTASKAPRRAVSSLGLSRGQMAAFQMASMNAEAGRELAQTIPRRRSIRDSLILMRNPAEIPGALAAGTRTTSSGNSAASGAGGETTGIIRSASQRNTKGKFWDEIFDGDEELTLSEIKAMGGAVPFQQQVVLSTPTDPSRSSSQRSTKSTVNMMLSNSGESAIAKTPFLLTLQEAGPSAPVSPANNHNVKKNTQTPILNENSQPVSRKPSSTNTTTEDHSRTSCASTAESSSPTLNTSEDGSTLPAMQNPSKTDGITNTRSKSPIQKLLAAVWSKRRDSLPNNMAFDTVDVRRSAFTEMFDWDEKSGSSTEKRPNMQAGDTDGANDAENRIKKSPIRALVDMTKRPFQKISPPRFTAPSALQLGQTALAQFLETNDADSILDDLVNDNILSPLDSNTDVPTLHLCQSNHRLDIIPVMLKMPALKFDQSPSASSSPTGIRNRPISWAPEFPVFKGDVRKVRRTGLRSASDVFKTGRPNGWRKTMRKDGPQEQPTQLAMDWETAQRLLEAKTDSEPDYDTPVEDEDEHDDGFKSVENLTLKIGSREDDDRAVVAAKEGFSETSPDDIVCDPESFPFTPPNATFLTTLASA